jgi:hypothetical protein
MNYKRILNFLLLSGSMALMLSSCKKPGEVEEVLTSGTPTLRFAQTPNSGNFLTQLYVPDLSIDADTLSLSDLQPKLEGPKTAPADIAVEYKVTPDAITRYNQAHASEPGFKPFVILPDSTYTIINKNDIIKKGEVFGSGLGDNIKFNTQKINTTVNYILPISITNPEYPTATATGTLLIYLIGNPIAGGYTWDYKRWNNAGTGNPSTTWTGEAAIFAPINGETIEVQSGYGDQNGLNIRYQLSFKNTNGVLSDFTVKINPEDVTKSIYGAIAAQSFTEATILLADPVNKRYKFTYALVNSAGATRTLVDEFYK